MQQPNNQKPHSPLARILALIAALIVLVGTIFIVFGPGRGSRDASVLPRAYATDTTDRPWKDLQKGASGADVRLIQTALQALGFYDGAIDGNFSKVFEEAVLAFQRDWGLEDNGVIDRETFDLLTADLPAVSPSPVRGTAAPTRKPSPSPTPVHGAAQSPAAASIPVVRGQSYSDKEHVAAYLKQFGELPPNYITKAQASALGWVASYGNLWRVAPGKSIGGDRYGNYEGLLPAKSGRRYYECDIDFDGSYRNGKRIVYSSDGLIFYTGDHYNTFEEIR